MTAAFSAADQRRRPTDPTGTAIRRSAHFASSLPSSITIARSSPPLQAKQAPPRLPLNKGARAPLTPHLPREGLLEPRGSHAFRAGHGSASPLALCRVWRDRDWHRVAIGLSVDLRLWASSSARPRRPPGRRRATYSASPR